MNPFRTNDELYAFVEELREFLTSTGDVELTDQLTRTNRFISGPPSEYLHEVYLALKQVLLFPPQALSGEREDEISSVMRQIDDTFRTTNDSHGKT